MIYLFLATGFEEIEALTTLDILRRCGLEVKTVSVTGTRLILGAHGIPVMSDCLFRRKDMDDCSAVILPGGMPGAKNLMVCDSLNRALVAHHAKGGLIAAICAAPMIIGDLDLLQGKNATCYPGFESYLKGALCKSDLVVEDDNIITGKGPGAAVEFAFAIARHFVSDSLIKRLKFEMILE